MPEPITERITQDVLATLMGVTPLTGYTFDAQVVRDEPKLGHSRYDGLVIVRENEEEMVDNPAAFTHEWLKSMSIEVYAVGDSVSSLRATANARMADLMAALRVDFTRGGLAIDTMIRPPTQLIPDEGGYYGVAVNIDVHYRTLDNDPYTQG
jgi:hypothetical protein